MVQGKAHKYPDNVDTDVIIPARYLNTADHKELAAHCMEDIDAQFKNNVRPGDTVCHDRTQSRATEEDTKIKLFVVDSSAKSVL